MPRSAELYNSYIPDIPRQLTLEWVKNISNWSDRKKLIKAYNEGVKSEIIYNYLKDQILYILTEWGVRHPIALQKPYHFQLSKKQNGFMVFDQNRAELGERSGRYLSFDNLGDAPNIGLAKAYDLLLSSDLRQDQAVAIYSRSKLYKQFNSQNDVLLVFSKTEQPGIFQGQYIFLDEMSDPEVDCILSQMNQLELDTDAENLASSPFIVDNFAINNQHQNPKLEQIAQGFENKFSKSMFDNTVKDISLVELLENLAAKDIEKIWSAMLFGQKDLFNQFILQKIKASLTIYAQQQGMDTRQVAKFIMDIESGRIQLSGGEMSVFSQIQPWDSYIPIFGWDQSKVCEVCHGVFYGSGTKCAKCQSLGYNSHYGIN